MCKPRSTVETHSSCTDAELFLLSANRPARVSSSLGTRPAAWFGERLWVSQSELVPEPSNWRRQKLSRTEERQLCSSVAGIRQCLLFCKVYRAFYNFKSTQFAFRYALCIMQHNSTMAVQPPTVYPPYPPLVIKM
jgi:hypothetical protein